MSIEAINGKGVNRGNAVCDDCGRKETVTCDYTRNPDNSWTPNEGQIHDKVCKHGWALVKGTLRCPSCEAKRKAQMKEKKMAPKTNVAPIRKADPKQKRLIILALEDAYDDTEKRYKGDYTDKSLAAEIGSEIMPGWVSEIREEFFGPAGNEEADKLRDDIEALEKETKRLIDIFAAEQANKIDALRQRLDGVVQAHDKRVRA